MEPADRWRPLAELLLGRAELTAAEVAAAAELPIEALRQIWRALGFPPVAEEERAFTRTDAEVLRSVRALMEQQGFDRGVLLLLTRVSGQALARIADAQVTDALERRARRGGAPAALAAEELTERIGVLVPVFERLLGHVWRHHLLAAVLRGAAAPSAADRTLTVGFADLVGFTTVSRALAATDLAAMVDRFEAAAYDQIVGRGGRVVKTIGDEVMFAVDDDDAAAEIGLALVEAFGDDPTLPDLRVGLAHGPVLAWEGDLYGPTVNLASRLVNLARPATVLLSDQLGRQLHDRSGFVLRHLRPVDLQGIGRVRSWVLRRA